VSRLPSLALCAAGLSLSVSCTRSPSPDQLKATLKQHPEILAEAIREHPEEIMAALRVAADSVQRLEQGQAARAEDERIGRELAHPRQPILGAMRAVRGERDAPVTIVVYSDFQCPYCRRDVPVLAGLLDRYRGRVRILLKQTPLPIHPHARAAAAMFEAILRQNDSLAWRYYDLLFANQERLNAEGERYLEVAAREIGADLSRARRDAASQAVMRIIDGDLAEFQSFGFSGTPGFLVNGVMLDGAHPPEAFERVIDRILQGPVAGGR
jgi:protein-disulfide isomerase